MMPFNHVTPSGVITAFVFTCALLSSCYSLTCDDACSQGIITGSCHCDLITPEVEGTDAFNIAKRQSDYMYNKIFKWGKRRFVNPPIDDDSLTPEDNLDRRIFRWGKRSGNSNERPENIFRWGKRSELEPVINGYDVAYGIDDVSGFDEELPEIIPNTDTQSYPIDTHKVLYGKSDIFQTIQNALENLVRANYGLDTDDITSKRSSNRNQAPQNRIFTWGKRSGTYPNKRQPEKEDLRKIFMWG